MGILTLLGPLAFKLIAGLIVVLGILATYFGIKRKGANEATAKIKIEQEKSRIKLQEKIDSVRLQDKQIDDKVYEQVKQNTPTQPPASPVKIGDKFKFILPFILTLGLFGCVTIPVTPSVQVDIPARPDLQACLVAPHPTADVIERDGKPGVLLSIPDAEAVKKYLNEAPPCYENRETLLNGYIQKLLNRLRALGGK